MLGINGELRIHLARPLAQAIQNDRLARQYYGGPPVREVLLLPEGAQPPRGEVPRLAPPESLRRLSRNHTHGYAGPTIADERMPAPEWALLRRR